MKEAFGGFEFGLTEMCFPFPDSRHKHKLTLILRQNYHSIGRLFAFLPQMYGAQPLPPFPISATVLVYWEES